VVPFLGRAAELDDLSTWCSSSGARFGVRLISGPGGAGKSRLAAELCTKLIRTGWRAGFLPAPQGNDDDPTSVLRPTLIIIDYVDSEVERAARLVGGLLHRHHGPPVRVLLIARNRGSWWTTFLGLEPLVEGFTGRDVALGEEPLLQAERDHHFAVASAAFVAALKMDPVSRADLSDAAFQFPLLVHLQALLKVLGASAPRGEQPPVAATLIEAMLRREAKHWMTGFTNHRVDLSTRQQRVAVALASFAGAGTREDLKELMRAHPDLDDAGSDVLGRVADAVHDLYPGIPHLGPLEPDLFTEWLVATDLVADSSTLAKSLACAATTEQTSRMLAVLGRAITSPIVSSGPNSRRLSLQPSTGCSHRSSKPRSVQAYRRLLSPRRCPNCYEPRHARRQHLAQWILCL
jgi:hypothetical protein